MSGRGPGSPFYQQLLADLRASQAATRRQSGAGGSPDPSAVDRDDDGQVRANPLWDPAAVDRRLDELLNGRWTQPWRRSGETEVRPPMVTEVDASGVDRREISRWVNPAELEQLTQQARWTRARQVAAAGPVYSVQHLLIQALQARVAQAQVQVRPPAVPAPPVGRPWQVGDLVRYCGEAYTITAVTPRKITCDSQLFGSFDVVPGSLEARRLQLIAAGLRLVPSID